MGFLALMVVLGLGAATILGPVLIVFGVMNGSLELIALGALAVIAVFAAIFVIGGSGRK